MKFTTLRTEDKHEALWISVVLGQCPGLKARYRRGEVGQLPYYVEIEAESFENARAGIIRACDLTGRRRARDGDLARWTTLQSEMLRDLRQQ